MVRQTQKWDVFFRIFRKLSRLFFQTPPKNPVCLPKPTQETSFFRKKQALWTLIVSLIQESAGK
jgi:hypothetical protein